MNINRTCIERCPRVVVVSITHKKLWNADIYNIKREKLSYVVHFYLLYLRALPSYMSDTGCSYKWGNAMACYLRRCSEMSHSYHISRNH